METLSCCSNESTWAMTIKTTIYVEANVTNIYAVSASPPLMASEKKIFQYLLIKISLSVAMATNQNQRSAQNSYG